MRSTVRYATFCLMLWVGLPGIGVEVLLAAGPDPKAQTKSNEAVPPAKTDNAGDPLPRMAVSRLGSLRWAHGNEVDFVTYLPDGQQVLTVDQVGIFRVWEKLTGKLIRQFGTSDCKQLYWHVYERNSKSKLIDVVGNPHPRQIVAVSHDGGTAGIAHGDGNISLWNIATGKKLRSFEANVATTLAFTPDAKSLFTRGLDQLVRQYDVETGKPIRTFGEPRADAKLIHCNDAEGMIVSPDNKRVLSIYLERGSEQSLVSIRSWEIETGKELPAFMGNQLMKGFASVAFTPQANIVALSDLDGVFHVWDLVASKEVRKLAGQKLENAGYSSTIAFSPDGKQFVTRSEYRKMCLWDTGTGRELKQYQVPQDRPSDFYTGNVAFSSDGLRIISPGRAGTVRQIETKTGSEIELPVSRHRDLVEKLALSLDGKTVLTLSQDHVLHLWKTEDGTEIKQRQLPRHIDHSAFSQDGKLLALAGYDEKLNVRLWDASNLSELQSWEVSGELDGRPTPSRRSVTALELSANGNRLIVREYEGSFKIWQISEKKTEFVPQSRLAKELVDAELFFRGQSLVISPDGTLLANLTIDEEHPLTFRLWEVASDKLVRKFDAPLLLVTRAMAFSPDGRSIANINSDRTISLWEVATGKQRALLGKTRLGDPSPADQKNATTSMMGDHLRTGDLLCLAFSPDGNLLAAGESSGRVRLFDLKTEQELAPLVGHIGPVVSLAFAANGKRLVSGSTDTTALVWEITPLTIDSNSKQPLEQKQLNALLEDLHGDDAPKAYRAIKTLRQFPKQVVPILQARLRPIELDQQRISRLILDLDSNSFNTRENASKELEKLGELAKDAIQKALDTKPNLEVQKRLEALRTHQSLFAQPEQIRALELLEAIGTIEAKQVVQTIARGTMLARITRDAKETVERMQHNSREAKNR